MSERVVIPRGSWCLNCGHGLAHGASSCKYDSGSGRLCDCTAYVDAEFMERQRLRDHELQMKRLEIEHELARAGVSR